MTTSREKQLVQTLICLGRKLTNAINDPDPEALSKLEIEYNCLNCDNYKLCLRINVKLGEC